jgi:hypothetical protein
VGRRAQALTIGPIESRTKDQPTDDCERRGNAENKAKDPERHRKLQCYVSPGKSELSRPLPITVPRTFGVAYLLLAYREISTALPLPERTAGCQARGILRFRRDPS